MTDFDKLIKKAKGQDKVELTVFYNARVTTLKKYQDDPTAANSRDYEAARDRLDECVKRLLPIYLPEVAASTEVEFFDSIPAAYAWLQERGYDITERSVRNHVHLGSLPAEKSRNGKVKSIRLVDLKRYAKNHLSRGNGLGEPSDDRGRMIKAQADKIEFENAIKMGKYIERDEEEQRDAAVLAAFRRHLETAAPDRLQEFIAQVGKLVDADVLSQIVARQPEWLAADMEFLDKMFDRFGGA